MTFLAVLASLLIPGTGHGLTGRWRLALIWTAAGMLPVIGLVTWVPLVHLSWPIRLAAAVDAAIRVKRAAPGTRHLDLAGGIAVAITVLMALGSAFVFEAFKAPASSMSPTLQIGDHFLANKLATPTRGDITVFWHPAGKQYVKRLVAVGGDLVSVRKGVLHVNGRPVPQREIGPTTYRDYDAFTDIWRVEKVIALEEQLGGHTYRVYLAPDSRETGEWFRDFPRSGDAYFSDMKDPCARLPMFAETEMPEADTRPQMTVSADGRDCLVPRGTVFFLGDNRDNSNDSRSWGVLPTGKIIGKITGIWWPPSRWGNVD